MAAINAFQTAQSLPVTGKVDETTWLTLLDAASPAPSYTDIGLGDTGAQVSAVQWLLKSRFVATSVTVDGTYSSTTAAAVTQFQSEHAGACVDTMARVGPCTWLQLLDALCNSTATVQDKITEQGCGTAVVAGLSAQLVQETNAIQAGLFGSLEGLTNVQLSAAVVAVPFLQNAAVTDLQVAVAARGSTVIINSALRTLAQQLMLFKWFQASQCGIPLAASPGSSNHNGGAAIDISDNVGWRPFLEAENWSWPGKSFSY
jgi:peptidoglycan hydrolase-like protein with peptidoglycan-binding domain